VCTLVIAIGNTLRGDDGVAHRVADLLGGPPGVDVRRVHQLTPELGEELAQAKTVVFVDADVKAAMVRLEPLTAVSQPAAITHTMSPNELVMLATRLYGFEGEAYLCRVPVQDFAPGSTLTPTAEAGALAAAKKVAELLNLTV
jgi:hydrogenase maturation protease